MAFLTALSGETIRAVTDQCLPCDELLDFTGKILSPGFIDIHTHGAGGCSFSGSGVEAVIHACHHHLHLFDPNKFL